MRYIGMKRVIVFLICIAVQMVHPQTTQSGNSFSFGDLFSFASDTLGKAVVAGSNSLQAAVNIVNTSVQGSNDIISNITKITIQLGSTAVDVNNVIINNVAETATEFVDSVASTQLDSRMVEFLEKFRPRMRQGISKLKIPILEPLEVSEIGLHAYEPGKVNITGAFKKVVISNLSTFIIKNAKFALTGPTVTANLTIPNLFITGFYNVFGVLNHRDRVQAAGPFNMKLKNVRIYVHVVLRRELSKLFVTKMDLDVSMRSATTNFEKITLFKKIDQLLNVGFQDFLPEALEIVKPDILPPIRDYLETYVNRTISRYTISDLIYLTGL